MPAKPTKIADEAPWSAKMTEYDEAHFATYFNVLEAVADGVGQSEICKAVFGIDADVEPVRARLCFESHWRRAKWMMGTGYRLLLENPCGIEIPRIRQQH